MEIAAHCFDAADTGSFSAAHLIFIDADFSWIGINFQGARFVLHLFRLHHLLFLGHSGSLFLLWFTQTPINADRRICRHRYQRHFKNFPIGRTARLFVRLIPGKHAVSDRHIDQHTVLHQIQRPAAFFCFGKPRPNVSSVFVLLNAVNDTEQTIPVVVKEQRH